MIQRITDTQMVDDIFGSWEEGIIWSAMQGMMGEIYAVVPENSACRKREEKQAGACDMVKPSAAMVILGDFVYFAGEPDPELVKFKPDWCTQDFIILVPENEIWAQLIEQCYGGRAQKVSRYAIKKEPGIFNRKKLQSYADSLPEEYELRLMDRELYERCKKEEWARDFVFQYRDYDEYERIGLGVVALKEGRIVAGVSSYSGFRDGIEIEIVTHEDYRRRGLATACAARIILECLDRNWYPSWDARTLWSVGLAEKLGYHYSHTYTAYEIKGY